MEKPHTISPLPIFTYDFKKGVSGFISLVLSVRSELKKLGSFWGIPTTVHSPDGILTTNSSDGSVSRVCPSDLFYIDVCLEEKHLMFAFRFDNLYMSSYDNDYSCHEFQLTPKQTRSGVKHIVNQTILDFTHSYGSMATIARRFQQQHNDEFKEDDLNTEYFSSIMLGVDYLGDAFHVLMDAYSEENAHKVATSLLLVTPILIESVRSNSFFMDVVRSFSCPIPLGRDNIDVIRSWAAHSFVYQLIHLDSKNEAFDGIPVGFYKKYLKSELGVFHKQGIDLKQQDSISRRVQTFVDSTVKKAKGTLCALTRFSESLERFVLFDGEDNVVHEEIVKQSQGNMPENKGFELKILVLGHTNSGKSTTIGHLQKLKSKWNGLFTIVNAPGHSKFLYNMFNGALVSLLLIDATTGVETDLSECGLTQVHASLAFYFGVKELICCINKMDATTPRYSESRFDEIKYKVSSCLKEVGFFQDKISFVPISGLLGDNMDEKSANLQWYKGPTLLEALYKLPGDQIKIMNEPLRMKLGNDVSRFKRYKTSVVLPGMVVSGLLEHGMMVQITSPPHDRKVRSIYTDEMTACPYVSKGVQVNFKVDKIKDLKGISFVSDSSHPAQFVVSFKTLVYILKAPPHGVTNGCCATVLLVELDGNKSYGKIDFLSKIDGRTGMELEKEPVSLKTGDVAMLKITLREPMVADPFRISSSMGWVLIIESEANVFEGIITRVEKMEDKEVKKRKKEVDMPAAKKTQLARATPLPTQPLASTIALSADVLDQTVVGSNSEAIVQQILDMGGGNRDRDAFVRALRAAYNDPERAVDYLYSGFPEQAEVAPAAQPPPGGQPVVTSSAQDTQAAVPSSGGPNANPLDLFPQGLPSIHADGSAGILDFLRNSQQFQALRAVVQANPQNLQHMLQELGKQNPQLARMIREHQADFLRLINEPVVEGEEDMLDRFAEEEEMPQAVLVTPEEQEAIQRLEAMGFDQAVVLEVFFACNKNEELAANYLLDHHA